MLGCTNYWKFNLSDLCSSDPHCALNQVLRICLTPTQEEAKKLQPHSSDENFCREQTLTLCCPLYLAVLSVRGKAQMVYA